MLRLSEQGTLHLQEIADEVGASVQTVCTIRKKARVGPQYLQQLRSKHQEKQQRVEQALQLIETKKAGGLPIWNAA